jgi:DNA-directed RNA polymerase specialized sigma24 family protein
MRKLPARAAGVLALRYSGLSYAEVGEAMGIGVGQVGTVLRRAEARLKREVQL